MVMVMVVVMVMMVMMVMVMNLNRMFKQSIAFQYSFPILHT